MFWTVARSLNAHAVLTVLCTQNTLPCPAHLPRPLILFKCPSSLLREALAHPMHLSSAFPCRPLSQHFTQPCICGLHFPHRTGNVFVKRLYSTPPQSLVRTHAVLFISPHLLSLPRPALSQTNTTRASRASVTAGGHQGDFTIATLDFWSLPDGLWLADLSRLLVTERSGVK